jgi:hypothetical protein
MAENQGGLVPVGGQVLLQPGKLLRRKLHSIGAGHTVRGQENQMVACQILTVVQGTEIPLILHEMGEAGAGIPFAQGTWQGREAFIHDFMVAGQEGDRVVQSIQEVPDHTLVQPFSGALDHIPGQDAQIHVRPLVDVRQGRLLVPDFLQAQGLFAGLGGIMQITDDHDLCILPGQDRNGRKRKHGQDGKQEQSGPQK